MHQVLVGGDDGHVAAARDGLARIGGDQIVGLVAVLLGAHDVEGAHCVADQRELRHEFLRRRRPVRLVLAVDLVAEALAARVEDDGDVGRTARLLGILDQLPQHGAKAMHRADRQPVRGPRQGRQRMEGAEDVARPVDQVDVAALAHGEGLDLAAVARGGVAALGAHASLVGPAIMPPVTSMLIGPAL